MVALAAVILVLIGIQLFQTHKVTAAANKARVKSSLSKATDIGKLNSTMGINVSPKVDDIIYSMQGSRAKLSSKSLVEQTNGTCSADTAALGTYTKILKADLQDDDGLTPPYMTKTGIVAFTKADQFGPPRAKEFKDYYLLYQTPEYPCGADGAQTDLQLTQAKAAQAAVATATEAQ